MPRSSTDRSGELKIWKIRWKREITVETIQKLVISRPERATLAWCQACADEVSMVSPEQVARMIGVDSRAVYRRVERGDLHFAESWDGLPLICLRSLAEKDPHSQD